MALRAYGSSTPRPILACHLLFLSLPSAPTPPWPRYLRNDTISFSESFPAIAAIFDDLPSSTEFYALNTRAFGFSSSSSSSSLSGVAAFGLSRKAMILSFLRSAA